MSKQALVIIDLQNGLSHMADFDGVVQRVNQRIKDFRSKGLPIIYVQHQDEELVPNTTAWQFAPELDVPEDATVVAKIHPDSFYHTELQKVLDDLEVTDLEICGAQSDYCVDTTIRVAFDRGYKIRIGYDMHTTEDSKYMTALQMRDYFKDMWNGRFAEVYGG
ncbi:cysteine hydrolase family protein [Pediococcus argentinicus]|uniref:Isochorismatase hydrolase n=1 Tax=Pediococcus argentinicus TaxID=480391 RepID=A0A0R2NK43_9LACO|nr:cysteine hydrolase family protein [Pediococcus argentinicus]KRO26137.1 isochorismatase hydrolase [Pediococcus argentinicus]NKZ21657.1 cysteine hydrolase [Pediococcus argentinicus]GEP18756.1 amidase [Pediococcus argentinicus]